MRFQNSVHYSTNTQDSADYALLLPSGGHVVRLGDQLTPHTVSMFHQLRCLDVIRQSYMFPLTNDTSTTATHCLNYIRQRLLCKPTKRIESARHPEGTTSKDYDALCSDWTALYDAAEQNYEYNHKVLLRFAVNLAQLT